MDDSPLSLKTQKHKNTKTQKHKNTKEIEKSHMIKKTFNRKKSFLGLIKKYLVL
jgi:hypothetical protein